MNSTTTTLDNLTEPNFPDPETDATSENFSAAFLCFLVSAPALFVTISVGYHVTKLESIKGQFAILTVSLAVADAGVLAIFTFWCVPMLVLQSELSTAELGRKIGHLSLLFYFSSNYMVVVIAVNRCMAILAPLRYDKSFSVRVSKTVVAVTWCLSGLTCIPYFFEGCDYLFYQDLYFWFYEDTVCGFWVGWISDFGGGVSCGIIALIFNSITALKLARRTQKVMNDKEANQSQAITAADRRKKEVRFFIQSLINSTMLVFMLIQFHVVSRFAYEKWGWFFSTSMIWQISHATNATTFMAMSRDLRAAIVTSICCLGTKPGAVHEKTINRTRATRATPKKLDTMNVISLVELKD